MTASWRPVGLQLAAPVRCVRISVVGVPQGKPAFIREVRYDKPAAIFFDQIHYSCKSAIFSSGQLNGLNGTPAGLAFDSSPSNAPFLMPRLASPKLALVSLLLIPGGKPFQPTRVGYCQAP